MALNITSGKVSRALKTVIYGTEGVGKSTLASQFPDPLFLDVEGGTSQLDIRRIEPPQNWEELVADVQEVSRTPGICKTLVLDTADWAEILCVNYVCQKYKQPSIESFGYGKGYTYLAEEWARLMSAFDAVIAAGMNVTITAHAKQRKIELPDQIGAYDHWEMKVSKQVAPILKEWADLLLFLNYKIYVVSTDSNSKKAQGGKRVMYTSHHPSWDAKNRHNLPSEMDLSFDGIAHLFDKTPKKVQSPYDRLREMMAEAGVEDYQLQAIVEERQLVEAGTPLSEYPKNILNGFCIKHFDKINQQIKGVE